MSSRGRTSNERANWEFAQQLAQSFSQLTEIFKAVHAERKGKKGAELVTLSDEVLSKITDWCYQRAKRRSSGFFSFAFGPSRSQIAVALRECQLHRKAQFTIRVATKARAKRPTLYKPPAHTQTPAHRNKVKNDIKNCARNVATIMPCASLENRGPATTRRMQKDGGGSSKISENDQDEVKATETKSYPCQGCNKIALVTDLILIEGERWHPQCFNCSTCSKPLLSGKIVQGRKGSTIQSTSQKALKYVVFYCSSFRSTTHTHKTKQIRRKILPARRQTMVPKLLRGQVRKTHMCGMSRTFDARRESCSGLW